MKRIDKDMTLDEIIDVLNKDSESLALERVFRLREKLLYIVNLTYEVELKVWERLNDKGINS